MKFHNYLPFDPDNESELRETVQRLAALANTPVTIKPMLVIESDSIELSMTLDQFKNAMKQGGDNNKAVAAKKGKRMGRPPGSGKKGKAARKKPRGKLARTWEIVDGGEMINRSELDRRLKAQKIRPGTRLHHPRHGDVVVGKGELPEAAYILLKDGELL